MDASPKNTNQNPESWGAVIGIVIIVALLVLGGVYFFMTGQAAPQQAPAVGAGRA